MDEEVTLVDVVSAWKAEAGLPSYKSTVAIHVDGDTLFIVTLHPGLFIGYHGSLEKKYSAILKKHGFPSKVRYVDMFVGNVKQF